MLGLLDSEKPGPVDPGLVDDVLDEAGLRKPPPKHIRCPKCRWVPRKKDQWCCTRNGCHHWWNTFDTRALCPKCSYQWEWTACLRCSAFSRHEDWYGE